MKLVSTRDNADIVGFERALLAPSASGGGLYAPLTLPKFDGYAFSHLSYAEFALKLIASFEFGLESLFKSALQSYEKFDEKCHEKHLKFSGKACPVRIFRASEQLFINELYRGPTRAFKDMALQPFGTLLRLLAPSQRLLIMCATSGDTGPATLCAFANESLCADEFPPKNAAKCEKIRVVCLYPASGTSRFQALQMTSLNALNLKVCAINGDFDAAQKALKTLLADSEFKAALNAHQTSLTAANSVNFGRILFQIIYHYYALVQVGEKADIIVPSGNFGDALGAYYAKKMGAKMGRIKIASNANNILTDFLTRGVYDLRGRTLRKTISPAMDILLSSNVERLIFDKFGAKRTAELYSQLASEKFFKLCKTELDALREDFDADFCSDNECKKFIKNFAPTALIDPHTATCFKLLDPAKPTIITSTAEWTKFVPSMFEALFESPCADEKAAMLKIASAYNYDLKPEIPALFDKAQNESRIYEVGELKSAILQWIEQSRHFANDDFKGL